MLRASKADLSPGILRRVQMVSWHPQCKLTWTIALECSSVSDKEGKRVRGERSTVDCRVKSAWCSGTSRCISKCIAFVHGSRSLESRHTANTATRDYYGNRATSLMVQPVMLLPRFFFFFWRGLNASDQVVWTGTAEVRIKIVYIWGSTSTIALFYQRTRLIEFPLLEVIHNKLILSFRTNEIQMR